MIEALLNMFPTKHVQIVMHSQHTLLPDPLLSLHIPLLAAQRSDSYCIHLLFRSRQIDETQHSVPTLDHRQRVCDAVRGDRIVHGDLCIGNARGIRGVGYRWVGYDSILNLALWG
jgi:hypothetical protein